VPFILLANSFSFASASRWEVEQMKSDAIIFFVSYFSKHYYFPVG